MVVLDVLWYYYEIDNVNVYCGVYMLVEWVMKDYEVFCEKVC